MHVKYKDNFIKFTTPTTTAVATTTESPVTTDLAEEEEVEEKDDFSVIDNYSVDPEEDYFYISDCLKSEFTCVSDGMCLEGELACDGVKDCDDGSDEFVATCHGEFVAVVFNLVISFIHTVCDDLISGKVVSCSGSLRGSENEKCFCRR